MTRSRGRPPKGESPLAQAVAWFKEHGVESTLQACQDGAGVGADTARRARRELKKAGLLPESFSIHDPGAGELQEPAVRRPPPAPSSSSRHRSVPLEPEPLVARTMDEALQRVLDGAVASLTPDQALQYASELVRIAPTFQLKLAALREVTKLRAESKERADLGPGIPLTPEDRRVRVQWMLEALGRGEALLAWLAAFGEEIVEVHEVQVEIKALEGFEEAPQA